MGLAATADLLLPPAAMAALAVPATGSEGGQGADPVNDQLSGAKTAVVSYVSRGEKGRIVAVYLLGSTAENRAAWGINLNFWRNVWRVVPVSAADPAAGYMFALEGYFLKPDMGLSASAADAAVLVTSGSRDNATIQRKGTNLILSLNFAGYGAQFAAPGAANTAQSFHLETASDGGIYFWLAVDAPNRGVRALECASEGQSGSGAAQLGLRAAVCAANYGQLWWYDESDACIYNRRNGRAMTCTRTAGQLFAQFKARDPYGQQWDLVEDVGLVNRSTSQVLALKADDSVGAAPKPEAPVTNADLIWIRRNYAETPDLTVNVLDRLGNGRIFQVCSMLGNMSSLSRLCVSHSAGGALSLAATQISRNRLDPIASELAWIISDGMLANYAGGQKSILLGRRDGNSAWSLACVARSALVTGGLSGAKWALTSDGLLVHLQSGLVLQGSSPANQVQLAAYDPLRPRSQAWMVLTGAAGQAPAPPTGLRVVVSGTDPAQSPERMTPSARLMPTSFNTHPQPFLMRMRAAAEAAAGWQAGSPGGSNNPHPSLIVTKMVVTVEIGDRWWAGTAATAYLGFNGSDRVWVIGYTSPFSPHPKWSSGESYSYNLTQLVSEWTFDQVQSLYITMDQPSFSDEAYIESVKLTVNDRYVCHADVSSWVEDFLAIPVPQHLWRMIDPDNPTGPGKAFDWSGRTYTVGLIPYLGDVRNFRTYDPSTIDGVGELLGSRNGRLIGCLLKSQVCEELAVSGDNDSYTWVFTPQGSIIYKKWDHNEDRRTYTRHSQLASGSPVICAGEFRVKGTTTSWGPSTEMETFIAMVNDASGHYKPSGSDCLYYVIQQLQAIGVATDNIQMYWKEEL